MFIRPSLLPLSLLIFCSAALHAQDTRLITGTVLDASNSQPLPFTSVGLKKQLIGIVTNEAGKFDMLIPAGAEDDTLVINSFGFRRTGIAVKNIHEPITIRLKPDPVLLQEVDVVPISPEACIVMAMRMLKQNY